MAIKKIQNLRKYLFIALSISFVLCFAWYFYCNVHHKQIQKRFTKQISKVYDKIENDGSKFVFKGDSLIFWNDNSIVFNKDSIDEQMIIETPNGIYLHKKVSQNLDKTSTTQETTEGITTHYFYLVKHKYTIKNKYLTNSFSDDFYYDPAIDIVSYKTDFPIIYNGKTICYLEASPECLEPSDRDIFIFRLWLVVNVFVLLVLMINSTVSLKILRFLRTKNAKSQENHRNFVRTNFIQILTIFILYVLYAVFCIITRSFNPNTSFLLYTSEINYNNILLFITTVLAGFLLYLICEKILSITNQQYQKHIGDKLSFPTLVKKTLFVWSIVIIGGIILTINIRPTPTQTVQTNDTYNATTLKNFSILMQASQNDSTITKLINDKQFSQAEDYIKRYYLSLLNEENHTSVLIFDNDDLMTIAPQNKAVNILSYAENRVKNTVAISNDFLNSDSTFDSSTINKSKTPTYQPNELFASRDNNHSYIYFHKGKDFNVFAECLKKINNNNLNYSLFLDKNFTAESSIKRTNDIYQTFFCISLLFLLFATMLGLRHIFMQLVNAKSHTISIRTKILISLLGSFIVSLLLIGAFAIKSSININKQNNLNILNEKTESIAFELEKLLAANQNITELDVIDLSNTFLVDINIFDRGGDLLTSSQMDFFNKGIISKKINHDAFAALNEKNILFYQPERICKGEFLASYMKIDDEDSYILNIPFINQQKIMSENINALINNCTNMSLILVNLAIMIFVLLSNAITKPIDVVKSKMIKVYAGVQNEKIVWTKNDEMGELIKAYNLMVDKIEQSALLLKQQERLSSWRELSRQVAHDIKNPLTPMKLSIQYLQKIYNEKPEAFEQKFKEITPSLISQIESISNITQELNSYSRPSVTKEKVDLNECILSAINLFGSAEGVTINYTSPQNNCYTIGEKTLFIRIFNNLIKNAVQSFYNKENGIIDISLKQENDKYIVSIEDNGCGIKDENKSKIFTPNFTTKANGGGIGLTIVKTILESYACDITFKSKENIGTIFFLIFPAMQEDK